MSAVAWGERLRRAREAKEWSQAELGRRLQPSRARQTIHAMETGRRQLDVELCRELALVLGVEPAWLAGWQIETEH